MTSPRSRFECVSRRGWTNGGGDSFAHRYVADDYVPAAGLSQLLPVGTLVVGRVLPPSEGAKPGAAPPLSLRRSDVEGGEYVHPPPKPGFGAVEVGMVATGKVKSVTEFGVFVRLDESGVDALCHKTEISDRKKLPRDWEAGFPIGEAVKVEPPPAPGCPQISPCISPCISPRSPAGLPDRRGRPGTACVQPLPTHHAQLVCNRCLPTTHSRRATERHVTAV